MKSLIIDAGNSRVTCAVWEGAGQLPVRAEGSGTELAPPVQMRGLADLAHPSGPGGDDAFLEAYRSLREQGGFSRVILVSVVPRIVELLAERPEVAVVDHRRDLPCPTAVADVSRVGPDRLCNVAAAVCAGLTDALVVDAGTATTFDLLQDGVFLGGMIAPGMAFAARRLGEWAARLEPVAFAPASWEVGRDTESAMAAGAWHTGRGGVAAVVAGLKQQYGDIPVIVTGGLGVHLDLPGSYHDPQWTLRGAAFLSSR